MLSLLTLIASHWQVYGEKQNLGYFKNILWISLLMLQLIYHHTWKSFKNDDIKVIKFS